MKKAIFFILFFIIIFARCSSDNDNVMRWKENDTNDLHFYIGSPEGGISIAYDTVTKPGINRDSLRNTIITRNFGAVYNASFYSLMTFEFNENKITYRDSADISTSKKIISDYLFRNDSLFVIKADKKLSFIALGTSDKLYRPKSFARFKNSAGRDTVITSDAPLDLQKVLDRAEISSFTNPTDTIKWVNIKYIFR